MVNEAEIKERVAVLESRAADMQSDIKEIKESVEVILAIVSTGKGAWKLIFGIGSIMLTLSAALHYLRLDIAGK